MPLSLEETKAAVKMYQLVRREQLSKGTHPLLRWGAPLALGLSSLLQIYDGKMYGYVFAAYVVILATVQYAVIRGRHRRYLETAVIVKVLERDHPEEFDAIRKYQSEEEKKASLPFYRMNQAQELANRRATP